MTSQSKLAIGAALLFSASILTTAAAGERKEGASEEQRMETVHVNGHYLYSDKLNALKAPTPIIDVPQSLSIISADQIAQRGFTSIGEIIDYTPGVNNSQGEGHRDAIVFRGVRSTADFYLDGLRDDVQYYRSLYNLEQVEILRGPNALLFGRGGTGGILNRVTKKGQIGEQFTGYQAGSDTFGAFDVALDTNFTVDGNTAFRINAAYESLDNHRDFYDGERFAINPTARFVLGSDTTLDVSYEYVDNERFIDRGIPVNDLEGGNFEPIEAFKDITFGDPELNTATLEANILRANLQHQFTDYLKGVVTAHYGNYDKLYQNFYAADLDAADVVELDGYVDTTQRTNLILSGTLVGQFNTGPIGHTLIGGVEMIDTSNDNDRFNPVFVTNGTDKETFLIQRPLAFSDGTGVNASGQATSFTFTDVNDNNKSDVETYSVFIQDQIELGRFVDIVLGARFDSFEQSTIDLTSDNRTPAERTDEEISPRAGIIFKPMENLSIYGSYSESFLPRSGGQFASTGSLDPDVFEQAEIGLKWDFLDRLSLTAAYFQNDQTRADRNIETEEEFEIRGLEVEGFELQLQGNVTDQFFITAGYSYLDGETGDRNEPPRELPRELPENTFSVWGSYQVTDKFGLGLGATYQDDAFITDLDIGNDPSTHPTLPAFTRVDAAAFYDVSDALRLQLNIENLTDEVYFPTSHATHQATVGAPLNARFMVRGRF